MTKTTSRHLLEILAEVPILAIIGANDLHIPDLTWFSKSVILVKSFL